jgi:hypothetical protein
MSIAELDYQPYQEIKLSALTNKEYIDAIMEQTDSDSDSENNSEEEDL